MSAPFQRAINGLFLILGNINTFKLECESNVKGTVHPKVKIQSLSTCPDGCLVVHKTFLELHNSKQLKKLKTPYSLFGRIQVWERVRVRVRVPKQI